MSDNYPNVSNISGVTIIPISEINGRITVYSEDQHLLKRFGSIEYIEFAGIDSDQFTLRSSADEYWVVIKSSAKFRLVDQRSQSPSHDSSAIIEMNAKQMQGLLIPFGVAYLIEAQSDACLIRMSTHLVGTHPEDQMIEKSEFSGLFSK